MKFAGLILLVLCSLSGSSQEKQFAFDNILEYEFRKNNASAKEIIYVLTNSKDNSYSAIAFPKDSANFYIDIWSDQDIKGLALVSKHDFYRTETISFNPQSTKKVERDLRSKSTIEYFDKSDTIIGGKSYRQYGFKLDKYEFKKERKKSIATYVIMDGTDFHSAFKFFAAYYTMPLQAIKLPSGIAKEISLRDTATGKLENMYRLTDYRKERRFVAILPKTSSK